MCSGVTEEYKINNRNCTKTFGRVTNRKSRLTGSVEVAIGARTQRPSFVTASVNWLQKDTSAGWPLSGINVF